jgi:predicted metal-dependent hydrolase
MIDRQVRDIAYKLLPGTDRNTTDIVIERNGEIMVRPPKHLTPERVDALVETKRLWIYRNLAEWRDLNAVAVTREWVNGESFLYRGRPYRLSIVESKAVDLKIKDGRFLLSRSVVEREGVEGARRVFEQYYSEKGLELARTRTQYFAPKVGVELSSVEVKDIGFKWGRCSPSGKLALHWKCMMAPARIFDYIVVHELCHLIQPDHSPAFWNEVDKVMPDFRERKEWLRTHGAGLDL